MTSCSIPIGQRTRYAIFAAALFIAGCGKKDSEASKNSLPSIPPASNPMAIDVEPALLTRIRVGAPSWGDVGAANTVAGRVDVDMTRITRIGSPVMGRITSLPEASGATCRGTRAHSVEV